VSYHSGKLRISEVQLQNYRQYYDDDNIFDFSLNEEQPITIIRGTNGAGKTNLMNAITWCFYGKEKNLSKENLDLPTINLRKYNETKEDGLYTTSVTVILNDEYGQKYKIVRKMTLFLEGKSNIYHQDIKAIIPEKCTPTYDQTFSVYDKVKGWDTTPYFENEIAKILPEELCGYFLFDGEKLEEFFEELENIKTGLEDVSKIIVTEKAITHLIVFKSDIVAGIKTKKPEIIEIQQKIKYENEEQGKISKKLEPIEKNLVITNKEIKNCEEFILQNRESAGLQKREIELNKLINEMTENITDEEENKKKYIITSFPKVILAQESRKAIELINNKIKKGELPPKIAPHFIDELLNEKRCICGTEIHEHSDEYSNLVKRKKIVSYTIIHELCSNLKYNLKESLDNNHMVEDLTNFSTKLVGLRNKTQQYFQELDEISIKLKTTKSVDINKKYEEKEKLNKERSNLERTKGALDKDLVQSENEIIKLEKDLDKELGKEVSYKFEKKRIKLCENAINELTIIKENLLREVRSNVQEKTFSYFDKLIWKEDTFDELRIDENYDIKIHHKDDAWMLGGLSKGEKLVLALSFMAALRFVADFEFPLLIDTPLGRVSGEPKENIAKNLPNFLDKQQIILLMTDTEYNAPVMDDDDDTIQFDSFKKSIESKMGKEVKLKYDEQTRSTSIQ
jgi:DNA sulfur modification protein DndD